ncbi:MAG: ATP-binding cassette domain-containing protein [Acholeplasmatales bacterium]|nr:ATP-binding cassette domain-containing protein [Acholeplasmatales bacterium]
MNQELAKFENVTDALKAEAKARFDEAVAKADALYQESVSKAQAVKDKALEEENAEYEAEIAPLKEQASVKISKEVKAANAVKIAELKAKAREEIEAVKAEINPKLPSAKEALKESKAKATITVAEYKANVKALYDKEIAAAVEAKNNSLAKLNGSGYDTKSEEFKKEAKEINSQYKESVKAAKIKRIDSLKITKAEAKRRAINIMKEVGIPYPEKRYRQYPFEFSGGMRQRIVIAIALTANPDILICDEPTTALDVTIQAQILELINKLKSERNLSCIFITHDLGVVANMADRVAVMYAGKIIEYGLVNEIFYEPKHPYTWALLSSIPDIDSKEKLEAIPGTPPNLIYPPKGDAFADRSHYALGIDYKAEPPYFKVSDTHYAATWLLAPNAPKVEMPKIVSERIRKSLEKGGNVNE